MSSLREETYKSLLKAFSDVRNHYKEPPKMPCGILVEKCPLSTLPVPPVSERGEKK